MQAVDEITLEPKILPDSSSLGLTEQKQREEKLMADDISILNGYSYAIQYIPSKGPRRQKRTIICTFPGCSKIFIKAWNFLDHARMHLGEKPFH
mmetsp:Transcript_13733/g.15929  ORF Transcript_13733/g.15929 Transcript_13733/m.15929 type:complete len:94 (-) Transcript_13733:123-404(-)